MRAFIDYLRRASQAGISSNLPRSLIRRIRTTNAFSLILSLLTLPYIVMHSLTEVGWVVLTMPPVGLSYLAIPWLNSRGHYYAGRILLVLMINLASFAYALTFGSVSGVHIVFLPLSALPLMIFEQKDRWITGLCSLLSFSLFFAVEHLHRIAWHGAPWIPMPQSRYQIVVLASFICISLVYLLQRSNDHSDEEIVAVLDDLQRETTRIHRILDSITDLIVLSDKYSRPLWGNRAFREFFGLIGGQTTEGTFARIPELLKRHRDFDRKVIEERRACWIEAEAITGPDGKTLWFNTVISPILDSDGQVNMIVSVCRDVTQQREMEELVSQQRVQMVANSKLSALGEMAAGIAHEVINPLAIVAGRSLTLRTLVASNPADPRVNSFAQDIEDGTSRIVKIIRGLQSFSRSGERDPLAKISLQTILDDTLTFCAARFADKGVELIAPSLAQDIRLECRPVQISQILLNLLNNSFDSVKDRKEKWVEVSIDCNESFVEISVTDSGPGIPADIRGRIFEPFFTTKPVGEGTGLGLSITRGLVESHGGTISLDETSPNTRIVVRMPLAQRA